MAYRLDRQQALWVQRAAPVVDTEVVADSSVAEIANTKAAEADSSGSAHPLDGDLKVSYHLPQSPHHNA